MVTVTQDKVDALRKVFRTMNVERKTLTLRITLINFSHTEGADRY